MPWILPSCPWTKKGNTSDNAARPTAPSNSSGAPIFSLPLTDHRKLWPLATTKNFSSHEINRHKLQKKWHNAFR
jgi:hypothetical protein